MKLFKNALIYDGTGGAPFKGDILVENDKILKVENSIDAEAEWEVIDLEGLSFAVSDISVELYGIYETYEEFREAFLAFVKEKPKYVKIKPEENPADILAECDRINSLLIRASI